MLKAKMRRKQKMSNSPLVNYTRISPNKTVPRKNKITKITIHHMAGNLSVQTCGNVFAPSSRQASSNYGIDSKGNVGMYVEEKDRAWTSSNAANDNSAVTIEVANDGGAPNWHVSDVALAKLIELCVDICKRNGIEKLNYTGDKNGNLTRHNMFVSTTCPGPYLQGKFQYIADEVNKRLQGDTPANEPVVIPTEIKAGDTVWVTGMGYASSDGTGAHTMKYSNKAMKVIGINKGAKCAYALNQYNEGTVGNYNDVTGWFSIDSIKLDK